MSDDLVKRLPDRIEELEKTVEELREDLTMAAVNVYEVEAKLATCEKYRDAYAKMEEIATQAVRDLDAKLAKVVEALKFYAYVDDDQGYRARTVLEEIGEKSDE